MGLKTRFVLEAQFDLESAVKWYEERADGLGIAFLDEIERAVTLAAENPLLFLEVMPGIRRALASRFPYAIYFLVDGERLVVLGVFHQARSPRVWKARVRKG